MKKAIPVIIAIVLILAIGVIGFGGKVLEKYSYGTETADMDKYFGVSEGKLAIVLQDTIMEEKALSRDGMVYFDLDTVQKYFNEGFYVDKAEQKLLYTTASQTIMAVLGAKEYSDKEGLHALEYAPCFAEGEVIYLAAEFAKKFANFSYEVFERHMQVYTEWGTAQTMEISKDTQVRIKGGIKSPILREIAAGEKVEILEEMETWTKVKTSDSIIGYVENKCLENPDTRIEMPVEDFVPEEYTSIQLDKTVCLGWHAIGGPGGNDTLGDVVTEGKGMNVISPTWFSLTDDDGNFRSFADANYVKKAHSYGLQVWAAWDDFNYEKETKQNVSTYQVLSSTTKRQKLVQNMVDTSLSLGLDGINIDYEDVSEDCGIHFVQFLRELSVLCREKGLILSVDNYMPPGKKHYRLDIQGQILDYVILMGYDEHYLGGPVAGSVASIDFVSNGLDRTLEQVPAEKVINAVPFYTILWKTEGADVESQSLILYNTADFIKRRGVTPVWDDKTCQNYSEWKSGEALYQIWFEDAESLKVKLNVMNAKDIAGVAVWRLGYGTPDVWSLLEAYTRLR